MKILGDTVRDLPDGYQNIWFLCFWDEDVAGKLVLVSMQEDVFRSVRIYFISKHWYFDEITYFIRLSTLSHIYNYIG